MTQRSSSQTDITPSFTPVQTGLLQRKCLSCGQHAISGGECAGCAKRKGDLQRKLAIGSSNDPLELEADRMADQVMSAPAHPAVSDAPLRIQRFTGQATGQADMVAPASVDRVLSSPGSPLEPGLQQDMGQRFEHDFSRVRVHTDSDAARSAREVNANAYTVRHDMVFGAGRFSPGTHEGRRLIAHELTHVVQQSGGQTTRLSRQNKENAEEKEETVDEMKGAVVSQIIVGLGNARVLFETSKGRVYGTVNTDLDPGTYMVEADLVHKIWVIKEPQVKPGYRFWVDLVGALPWTMNYPQKLSLVVDAGALQSDDEKASQAAAVARNEAEVVPWRDVRASWADKRGSFISAASDPANKLDAHQIYQIWLRVWMEKQARANADFDAIDKQMRSAPNKAELINKMSWFKYGKRKGLGEDFQPYIDASDHKDAVNFLFGNLREVLDWLENYVDIMKNHVTLEQVNAKALEIARDKANFQQYFAPIILGVIGMTRVGGGGVPREMKGVTEPRPRQGSAVSGRPPTPPGENAATTGKTATKQRTPVPRPLQGGGGGDRTRSAQAAGQTSNRGSKGNLEGPLGPRKPETTPLGQDVAARGENLNADALNRHIGRTVQSPELVPEVKEQLATAQKQDGLNPAKNPDHLVQGRGGVWRVWDSWTPQGRTAEVKSVLGAIRDKVTKRQTVRIAINLDGVENNGRAFAHDLKTAIKADQMKPSAQQDTGGIREVVIVKGGEVIRVFP
ncbi:MAG: DUF4157 domain-containing protein [Thermosynechococcaceae cyanobacterium]